VIKDGKVEACGKDVDVPAGAKVVDATGKTIMPGLVSAWSRAGLNPPSGPDLRMRGPNRRVVRMRRTPRSTGRASNNAATKIVERIYARQPIFGELLENGVTSLALNPISGGFAGLGAVLDPSGRNLRELTLDDDAFVQISMVRDGATKKMLGETFAKAKQVVEERTDLTVERRTNLGGTMICWAALEAGEIDAYVEYTGTGWAVVLGERTPSTDPLRTYLEVRRRCRSEHGVVWLSPLGFENTYALAMPEARAQALGIRRISDLVAHQDALRGKKRR